MIAFFKREDDEFGTAGLRLSLEIGSDFAGEPLRRKAMIRIMRYQPMNGYILVKELTDSRDEDEVESMWLHARHVYWPMRADLRWKYMEETTWNLSSWVIKHTNCCIKVSRGTYAEGPEAVGVLEMEDFNDTVTSKQARRHYRTMDYTYVALKLGKITNPMGAVWTPTCVWITLGYVAAMSENPQYYLQRRLEEGLET